MKRLSEIHVSLVNWKHHGHGHLVSNVTGRYIALWGPFLAIQCEKQLNIIVSSRDMHIQRFWMASKFYGSIHGVWELGDFG